MDELEQIRSLVSETGAPEGELVERVRWMIAENARLAPLADQGVELLLELRRPDAPVFGDVRYVARLAHPRLDDRAMDSTKVIQASVRSAKAFMLMTRLSESSMSSRSLGSVGS